MPGTPSTSYDVIVIGGGHAGAEAAWAAANLLRERFEESNGREGRVALVTIDPHKTGVMSCNPAIGGLAKGQIVREIDALGGLMPLAADATGIQFRVLNQSKGPAVRGPRCQSDKYAYAREVQRLLSTRPNIQTILGTVEDLLIEESRCVGISLTNGDRLLAPAVVLTTGTFMRGLMHTGQSQTSGGRVGEKPAVGISLTLQRLGFELARLKTGTPPRLHADSIDLAGLERQPGNDNPEPFSDLTRHPLADRLGLGNHPTYVRVAARFPVIEQRVCWITQTTPQVHDAIRANLDRAPMYNGQIETAGPRYCPSIEDKVVRFADRTSHHVFLEPESLESDEIYCNGISTSLPADVQEQVVRGMPGCEHAKIIRHGYAVEYDMVPPHQIDATTMTKRYPGLFLAGQINGTSGYEEAAGQGLIAGLNAVRYSRGDDLVRLRRDQAYIGVLMDDLVTKTPREPYRMFTSRAEHRLLLRADNAWDRLAPLARDWGLLDKIHQKAADLRDLAKQEAAELINQNRHNRIPFNQWIRRPEINLDQVVAAMQEISASPLSSDRRILASIVADSRYAGYIARQQREIEQLMEDEAAQLPTDLDYTAVGGLRTEAALALNKFKPATIGQATRIEGVNPADLMLVRISLTRGGARQAS
ncbi:tRNA uridine-5-carboxymethylaminomethyl(34) synthesis enzyme MnmG [Mucisphaera sp.]|uniref:tRNA uridine-5-carboxymethylaminomethyl(34) synthesis enzyme MnmG n=1 Tax=Mucisphaera sp. TaxID=2913024 RepID=UPI003D0F11AF